LQIYLGDDLIDSFDYQLPVRPRYWNRKKIILASDEHF
jgi:hypothetical protein